MKVLSRRRAPVAAGGRTAEPSFSSEAGAAIQVMHLRKTYRDTVAVDDVSFSVREGEIFGILGPNGAGKTTIVECVIGLRTPDAGVVRVMGLDPQVDRDGLHASVGVQLQASVLPGHLKVGEILDLFHSFYQHPADLEELTAALEPAAKKNEYYKSLSGASSSGSRSRWPSSATRRSRCSMR